MGGGTGTGAAPTIAKACRAADLVTVGIVTMPFAFEGVQRSKIAVEGIKALQDEVDTLVVLPNQHLISLNDANIV